jgi:hypothetical protein
MIGRAVSVAPEQFLVMALAQLTYRESLPYIEVCLGPCLCWWNGRLIH